jgi:abequosyltransferase
MLRISFAIPTYNFGSFLAETVDSIFRGANQLTVLDIEVVIVDGASSDHTCEVASELALKYPNLRYVQREQRGGIDFDMNLAASMCSGEYIWLLSADDVLDTGWDDALLPAISDHSPDVILVPAWLCTFDMKPMRRSRVFDTSSEQGMHVYQLNDDASVKRYLRQALTLEALFSYMSSIVVRRSTWISLPERSDYFGSCWAHCARLIRLLQPSCKSTSIIFLNSFLLNKRSGNDSFMENGLIRRLAISVDGWHRIATDFFPDLTTRFLVLRLIHNDASLLNFMYAILGARSAQDKQEVQRLGRIIYMGENKTTSSSWRYWMLLATPRLPFLENHLRKVIPRIAQLRHWFKGLSQPS